MIYSRHHKNYYADRQPEEKKEETIVEKIIEEKEKVTSKIKNIFKKDKEKVNETDPK